MKINNSIKISKLETYQGIRVKSNGNIEKFFSKEIGHQKAYKFEYVEGVGVKISLTAENKPINIIVPFANIAQIHYTEVAEPEVKRQDENGAKVADKVEIQAAAQRIMKEHKETLKKLKD